MNVIETDGLTKRFGDVTALEQASLSIARGHLFGFLGPNGAGKTTAIRILLGLLRASAGAARVFGLDTWRDGRAIRARIGYLPGEPRYYENLTGRQTLRFLAGVRRTDCRRQIARLAARFDLNLDRKLRAYSSGMRQKLGLIQALMHEPPLLILDEPTNALDPLVRQTLFAELRAVTAAGRTVLLSSHELGEVEALCDEVAIVRAGRIVAQERVADLRARAVRRVELVFASPAGVPAALPAALHVRARRADRVSGTWTGPVNALLEWLADCRPLDVTVAPPDLADLFMDYYADPPNGAAADGQP